VDGYKGISLCRHHPPIEKNNSNKTQNKQGSDPGGHRRQKAFYAKYHA